MTLRAGPIIESARFRHPQFTRAVVPTSVACQFLTEVQYQLLLAALQVRPTYMQRTWAIALLPDQDIAEVGGGSLQGAPLVEGTLSLERSQTNAGALATLDPDRATLEGERAITGAGASTLSDSTRSWTVDYFFGQIVRITAGPGAGQVRTIASNTATQLTLDDPWDVVPSADDATFKSMYTIENNDTEADGSMGAIIGDLPVQQQQNGWTVRFDATGQPYLDLTSPVQVSVNAGIPLPPNYQVDHGTVKLRTGNGVTVVEDEFTIIEPTARFQPPRPWCGYVAGEQLYLAGPYPDWRSVVSIEVPYVPLPPALTTASDPLMLPAAAEQALIAGLADLMRARAQQLGVFGADDGSISSRAAANQQLYVNQVMGVGRGRVSKRRSVY